MTDFRSEQRGQFELGIVTHEGREFAAGGSSVSGRNVTAYTKTDQRGNVQLCKWTGQVMLSCRSEVVGEYWTEPFGDDTNALVFALTNNRYIVGYALGLDGMLFRGELIDAIDSDDATRAARESAEHWIDVDYEDHLRFEEECREEEEAEEERLRQEEEEDDTPRFSVSRTYEIVTPESAEIGDSAENGYEFENVPMTWSETVRELESCTELSSWPIRGPEGLTGHEWATTEPEEDYTDGSSRRESVHVAALNGPVDREVLYRLFVAAGLIAE